MANTGLKKNQCQPFTPPNYERHDKIETLFGGCRWPVHATLTKASTIKDVGYFDVKCTSCEDFDLWLRIAPFNTILLVPEVLAFYNHRQTGQMTSNHLKIALNHLRVQLKFLRNNPKIANKLGTKKVNNIIYGELLRRAYVSYWQRDLKTAHTLFRKILFQPYFNTTDLKHIIPALLPFSIYERLISYIDKQ